MDYMDIDDGGDDDEDDGDDDDDDEFDDIENEDENEAHDVYEPSNVRFWFTLFKYKALNYPLSVNLFRSHFGKFS